MLNTYPNPNEWPNFVPFTLCDLPTRGRTIGSLRQDPDRVFGTYEQSLHDPSVHATDHAQVRDAGNGLRGQCRPARRFEERRVNPIVSGKLQSPVRERMHLCYEA